MNHYNQKAIKKFSLASLARRMNGFAILIVMLDSFALLIRDLKGKAAPYFTFMLLATLRLLMMIEGIAARCTSLLELNGIAAQYLSCCRSYFAPLLGAASRRESLGLLHEHPAPLTPMQRLGPRLLLSTPGCVLYFGYSDVIHIATSVFGFGFVVWAKGGFFIRFMSKNFFGIFAEFCSDSARALELPARSADFNRTRECLFIARRGIEK